MKKCIKCKKEKLNSEFWRDKYRPDGLCSQCKLCKTQSKEKRHNIYLENKEKTLLRHKIYYIKNREEINTKRKEYGKKYYNKVKGSVDYVYSCYKASAKRRGIEFELSLEEFRTFQKICYYCGSHAIGLDRIDNNLGYLIDNCASCCEICNKTKQTLSLDEWNNYLTQIAMFNKYNCTRIISRNIRLYSVQGQYGMYRRSAKRRKKFFNLTFEQFKSFLHVPCHYCGSITKNIIGLDRVDNNIGYLMDNCVSCCKVCNIGKNNLLVGNWEGWINNITEYKLAGARRKEK